MSRVKRMIRSALADESLGAAVLSSCDRSVGKRDAVIAEINDLESARMAAREVRERSLDRIERFLDEFESNFTAAGGVVHHAASAEDACTVVTGILAQHGARRGVKAKSMVSEEIKLGHALREAGIDAVESDLGEFIVQLRGEPPSHITAPALHLSRQAIGRLFAERLGVEYSMDPEKLTAAARDALRGRFLSAEFAISGANFIVAETGHLLVVENEGNGRMGMTLAPVFIAVCGIEKVVENLSDAAPLLNLLARSATGQRATTYVHMLKPTRQAEDGPAAMHVVLVDNGRRKALEDPELREMLLCIRCGACLNVCPVYRSVGGHAYDSVYPGPMGAIWSNIVDSHEAGAAELPQLSTLCGACRDICPVKIDIPGMLLELRARSGKSAAERAAAALWGYGAATRSRFELGMNLVGMVKEIRSLLK